MKNIVSIIIVTFSSFFCYSQTENSDKKFEFGFNLGVNQTNLRVNNSDKNFLLLYKNKIGFDLGIMSSYNPSRFLSIVPSVEISFSSAYIEYSGTDEIGNILTSTKDKVYPASLAFKTHLHIKPLKGNMSPYLIVGPNVRLDIEDETNMTNINFKSPPNFALDFGLGFSKKFNSFTFSPDIIYSYGFSEVSPFIDGVKYHKMSLILNFKE